MRRPSFFKGVVAGLVLAFSTSVGFTAVLPMLGFDPFIKLLVPALGIGYVLFLFKWNEERTGRATTLVLWLALSIVIWLLSPPLMLYVLIHVAALWLIRSLYFYSGIVPAIADLCLSGLSVAVAYWAAWHTGSPLLTVWCFFLVQALFVAIPPFIKKRTGGADPAASGKNTFEHARDRAEAAVRQLFTQTPY